MADVKHTDGPWGISSQSPTIIKKYDFMGETNVLLASASSYPDSGFFPTEKEAIANALLIAAAPDLLEALQEIIADGVHCDVVPHLHRKAVAAIAKATGGAARATEGSAT